MRSISRTGCKSTELWQFMWSLSDVMTYPHRISFKKVIESQKCMNKMPNQFVAALSLACEFSVEYRILRSRWLSVCTIDYPRQKQRDICFCMPLALQIAVLPSPVISQLSNWFEESVIVSLFPQEVNNFGVQVKLKSPEKGWRFSISGPKVGAPYPASPTFIRHQNLETLFYAPIFASRPNSNND